MDRGYRSVIVLVVACLCLSVTPVPSRAAPSEQSPVCDALSALQLANLLVICQGAQLVASPTSPSPFQIRMTLAAMANGLILPTALQMFTDPNGYYQTSTQALLDEIRTGTASSQQLAAAEVVAGSIVADQDLQVYDPSTGDSAWVAPIVDLWREHLGAGVGDGIWTDVTLDANPNLPGLFPAGAGYLVTNPWIGQGVYVTANAGSGTGLIALDTPTQSASWYNVTVWRYRDDGLSIPAYGGSNPAALNDHTFYTGLGESPQFSADLSHGYYLINNTPPLYLGNNWNFQIKAAGCVNTGASCVAGTATVVPADGVEIATYQGANPQPIVITGTPSFSDLPGVMPEPIAVADPAVTWITTNVTNVYHTDPVPTAIPSNWTSEMVSRQVAAAESTDASARAIATTTALIAAQQAAAQAAPATSVQGRLDGIKNTMLTKFPLAVPGWINETAAATLVCSGSYPALSFVFPCGGFIPDVQVDLPPGPIAAVTHPLSTIAAYVVLFLYGATVARRFFGGNG